MRTSDFDYHLPSHLIAQTPVEPRDSSRLLVLHRDTGRVEHRHFYDLADYLGTGDVLVFNDSRVIPARLYGSREDTGGKVEFLLLQRIGQGVWKAVGKPGRRLRPGSRFIIEGHPSNSLTLEVLETAEEDIRIVRLSTEEGLDTVGHIPLPPYIHTPLDDGERYQTVYSRAPGSVAAPTAGLHFTPELLDSLAVKGVQQVYATLHVGLDTFRPIRGEAPEEHKLHGEYFELSEDGAARLNAARREGRRIIAVGTTSVRLLEQAALISDKADSEKADAPVGTQVGPIEDRQRELLPISGWADLYILPGHRFRMVDAMITNFHLPRTTLLMLVSALAGRELILKAYREAVSKEYRFYSFGDGMLIL